MKVVGFFNSKGGSGKSTLAVHLGVAASKKRNTVLLDTDPQGTLSAWSNARNHESPVVQSVSGSTLSAELTKLRKSGVELAVLDCPPYITPESTRLVALCDFVVVPVQPTMPDIAGCNHAVRIIQSQETPFAFILNRAPARAPEVAQSLEALTSWGVVMPCQLGDRRAFSRALASGQSVAEMDEDSPAALEAAAACEWILNWIDHEKA